MTGNIIGYARTSTLDQVAGLDDQIAALTAAGCDRIWREQVSSVDAKRPELAAALDWLRDGDTFVVTKPDRLARSVRDLLAIIDTLKAKGVAIRILSMGVDTSTPTGELILTVLGGVAEWERKIMLERQRAGIAKAQAEGKYRGRRSTIDPAAVMLLRTEGKSLRQIGQAMGCDAATVHRILARL